MFVCFCLGMYVIFSLKVASFNGKISAWKRYNYAHAFVGISAIFSIQTYLYFVCVWVFFPSTILWNIISLICFRIFAEFPIPDTVNANAKAYSAIYIMNITVFSTPKEIQLSFVKIIIVSKLFLWTIVPNLSADNQSIVRKLHNTISMWPAANLILLRDKEPFLCILSSRWLLIR